MTDSVPTTTRDVAGTLSPEHSRLRREHILCALYVVGVVLWSVSLFYINISGVNGLGFAAVFSPLTWLALAVSTTALLLTIFTLSSGSRWFWPLCIGGLLEMLLVIHGTPMILESAPRFFEAYQHIGFIEYVYRTHAHSTAINYRLSWFGAFGMAATLAGTAGPPALIGAVRWTPLVFDTVILIPVHSITRRFVPNPRTRALVLVVFVIGNWIGQDYLSPQALAYFLSMTVIALLLHLAPFDGTSLIRWHDWRSRMRERWLEWNTGRQAPVAVLAVAGIITLAIVLAHQISPIMVLGLVVVLSLVGVISVRYFPLVVFGSILTYLSVGAGSFWIGNISRIFGVNTQSGQSVSLVNILRQNLIERLQQFGLAEVVAFTRFGLTLVLLVLAGAYSWLNRRDSIVKVVAPLAVVPYVILLMTGYGGEALLRAFFFSLPFVSILVAHFITSRAVSARSIAIWCIALVVLAAGTEFARYGNEQFEQISHDQLVTMTWLYNAIPRGTTMLAFGSAEPINFLNYGNYTTYQMDYFDVKTFGPGSSKQDQIDSIISQTDRVHPQLVIWTPEAALFDVHVRHYAVGWDGPVLEHIESEPGARFVVNLPDIKIIDLDPSLHLSPPRSIANG